MLASCRTTASLSVISVTLAAGHAAAQEAAPAPETPPAAEAKAPVSLSIEEAMRLAERTSHPVATARADVEGARADVLAARSAWLPQIDVSGSYVRTIESEFDGLFDFPEMGTTIDLPFGRANTWRVGLSASQLVYDFGRTSASIALARTGVASAEVEVATSRAQAVLRVTEAYYDAALAGQLVEIAEASLRLAEDTLALTRLGFEQGTRPEFDVLRSEVTVEEQRTALIRYRAQYDLALARLRRLIGLPLDRELVLTSPLTAEPAEIAAHARDVAGVTAPEERAPVVQAEVNVRAQVAALDVARASRWPQLALVTDLGFVNYPEDPWPSSDWRTNWTVGVAVSVPLFTGFRTTAQIRGARAQVRAAEAILAETTELAALDVLQVASDLEVAGATVTTTTRSVDLARRAYEIAEVRFEQGVSTFLELADARLALDRAQISAAQAARDLRVARVREALLPALPLGAAAAPPADPFTEGSPAAGAPATAAPPATGAPPAAGGIPTGSAIPTSAP